MAVSSPVGSLLSFVKKARLTQLKWSQKTKPGLCSGHLPGLATFQNLYPRACPPLSSRGFCLSTLNSLLPTVSTIPSACLLSSPMTSPPGIASTHAMCVSQQPDLTPPTTGHCYLLIIYYGDSHFARMLCFILKKTLHFVYFVWRYGPHRCGDQRASRGSHFLVSTA